MTAPRRVKGIISRIRRFRDDVTLFRISLQAKVIFKPGQFLHLSVDEYLPGDFFPESRIFSIANAPGNEFLEILISPRGEFTKRMIHELQVGSEVWLKLPYGTFNFEKSFDNDIVMIAGGTGISPFISLFENMLRNPYTFNSLSLYYGVRYDDLIIFEENLKIYRKRIKGFNSCIYCENVDNRLYSNREGKLPVVLIIQETLKLKSPDYYLSGPVPMILSFIDELKNRGIDPQKIFYDRWE